MIDQNVVDAVCRRIAAASVQPAEAEIAALVREEATVISDEDVVATLRAISSATHGAGPLDRILALPGVTDVTVTGADQVYFDRGHGLEKAPPLFTDDQQVRRLAVRLAVACGRRLDDAEPCADGRLTRPDGSTVRVHAILAPPSDSGPCISLRVLRQAQATLPRLVETGTMSSEIADVLARIVKARVAFLIVGGTGSGKTTLLGAMLNEIQADERLIIIEDTPELKTRHEHTVNLVARPANAEGQGAISMSHLLKQALRMRPDRIVVGEIRGAEVIDLLSALNTGHDGGAGTIHANSPLEVPARLEALAALGGMGREALFSQAAAALDVIIAVERTPKGRFLTSIATLDHCPPTVTTIWSRDAGPGPGWDAFLGRLP